MAHWSVIWPEPQREAPVNIANKSIKMLECIINIRQPCRGNSVKYQPL